MSETANYNLYVEDGSSVPFLDWRKKINGTSNSNMVKIDTALADLDSAISQTNTKAQEYASAAENSAKSYTDAQIAAIPTPDVSGQINAHNVNTSAHNDIRISLNELATRLNALADSDDITLDQMSEVVAYIKDNRELIEQITTNKVSVVDIVDNLSTNVSNKPLSAAQGVVLSGLVDTAVNAASAAQATADGKPSAIFVAGETEPADTRLLWIDTDASDGGLKYYNGSAWVCVPMVIPVVSADPANAINGQAWVVNP